MSIREVHSGGCQCGAIRYKIAGELGYPHICHCRMCQKAGGNFFMAFAGTRNEDFLLTRGEPSWFRSSDPCGRGFCAKCGTPLLFKTASSPYISVTIGSLDDPEACAPVSQDGAESRVSYFDRLFGLPERETDRSDLPGGTASVNRSNHQHPDHDTAAWPPREDRS
ncbi:GFA family protein [Ciceribacter azotifigens]|uniref:GFA family protein n=1 Tax=Ciceribacter azotifigens TaxID=2069303 RepID=UPI003A85E2D0